ncbi:MAG: PEP-CTERM sorting domain-containing protein [Planctomycetota bacterium]
MKTVALLAFAGVASTAAAQDLTINVVERLGGGTWDVTAVLNNPTQLSMNDIVQVWADAEFQVTAAPGLTIDIDEGSVNPAYTTTLGPFVVTDDGTNSVGFVGNANSFFGTPDASNPLSVLTFTTSAGSTPDTPAVADFQLVGQNSALFDLAPFGEVILYQDALGNLIDPLTNEPYAPFNINIVPIPAPASAALLGLGGLAAVRRRR